MEHEQATPPRGITRKEYAALLYQVLTQETNALWVAASVAEGKARLAPFLEELNALPIADAKGLHARLCMAMETLFADPVEYCILQPLVTSFKPEDYTAGRIAGYFTQPLPYAEARVCILQSLKEHAIDALREGIENLNDRLLAQVDKTFSDILYRHQLLLPEFDISAPEGVRMERAYYEAKCAFMEVWERAEQYLLSQDIDIYDKKFVTSQFPLFEVYDSYRPNADYYGVNFGGTPREETPNAERDRIVIPSFYTENSAALRGVIAHELGHYLQTWLRNAMLKELQTLKPENAKDITHDAAYYRAHAAMERDADWLGAQITWPSELAENLRFLKSCQQDYARLLELCECHSIPMKYINRQKFSYLLPAAEKEWDERYENAQASVWKRLRKVPEAIAAQYASLKGSTHPLSAERSRRMEKETEQQAEMWEKRRQEEQPHNPLGGIAMLAGWIAKEETRQQEGHRKPLLRRF